MSNQQPIIHVIPQTALVDERASITVIGLAPGQVVNLTSHMDDFLGLSSHWEAEARFQADARGTVDVSTQKSLSGDYDEVDQMGLFRFMKLKRIKKTTPPRRLSEVQFTASIPIHFTVQADGALLASATMTRRYMSEDVEVHPVLEEGVVGKVFYKRVDQPRPAIIIVGGSNGGLAIVQHLAALFASHGYVALAIAYFGLEPLPEALSHIPVELVGNALHWLERQSMVDQDKIGIYGASNEILVDDGRPGGSLCSLQIPTTFWPPVSLEKHHAPGHAFRRTLSKQHRWQRASGQSGHRC
jgi:Acyl-CoA thioester hydrolase/BAAT N-terminal region